MAGDQRHRRLEALYVAHADEVHAYVRRRAEAAVADDVVMEVFVVACRRLEEVPDPALPWLLGCARRVMANQRRSATRAEALTDRLRSAARAAGIDEDGAGRLAGALEQLSDGDREVLFLSSWEGLDLRELAVVLGCSHGAAGVRLHRARRRLRRALDQAGSATRDPRTAEVTA